jgi:ABC-type nitrate/sulfonate/bicarbonate transport system permease component
MSSSRCSVILASLPPIAVVTLAWWGLTATGFVDPVILPTPGSVAKALNALFREQLLSDVAYTLGRCVVALTISILVGVPVGLWLGFHVRAYRAVEGIIHALRSVPAAALFPLFLVAIGVGESSIVALASYNSLMVILINTVTGTLLANSSRIYHSRLLGVDGLSMITQVLFWEALPHILGGIRIALGYTLALVIAVEMFIGVSHLGLGRRIFEFQAAYRIPETYAVILVTSALGISLNFLLGWVEKRSLRWHPDSKE